MKTRIIFWAVPVILAAIIVGVFYQLSLEDEDSPSISLDQDFAELEPEPDEEMIEEAEPELELEEPEPEEETQDDVVQEPSLPEEVPETPAEEMASAEETELETAEVAETTPDQQETQQQATIEVKEEPTPPETAPAEQTVSAKELVKTLEHAALVETSNELWNIVTASNKENEGSQWQTILILNNHKWDYTILPIDSGQWKIVKTENKLRVHLTGDMEEEQDGVSRQHKGKYAMQMLSVEQKYFARALKVVQDLVHDGYYAYLHRTREKFEDKHWFRVRVGFFESVEEAQAMGQEIYFRYRDVIVLPNNYWAVLPSPRELNDELVDFQAQQNKPWLLELPLYDSRENAIKDLPDLTNIADFAYLAYKLEAGKIQYRMRIGFFETQDEANQLLQQLRQVRATLGNAKSIKL